MIINQMDFPIYTIIIALSVFIGALYIFISLKSEKFTNKNIAIFFIMFFILAIITGKLFTFVAYGFKTSFWNSKLSAYGGLIGVVIASFIYEKIYPSKGKVIKYTTLSLPLIYSFTKIGCFFVGCCYGIPYNGLFAVTYPHIMNKSLFPIQFLEIIVFFGIFLFCNTNKNRKDITYITFLLIAIFKFLLDFLRYSHINQILSPNQIFSIFLFILALIIYYKRK